MAEATNNIRYDQQPPSVERILAVVRDENKRMHEEVRTLRNELRELTSAVATQSAYMQQYMKQKFMPQNPPSKAVTKFEFPIQTESDLADFESSITDENREDCVAQIRSKICRVGSLASSLTNILSEQILLDYNVDGMSGRKRLRQYVNFFNALLEAIKLNDSSEPATKQLANAISKVKTRARYKDKLGKSLTSSEVVYLDSSPFDGSCDDADTMPSMEDDEDFHEDKLIANSEEYLITELVDESKLNLKDIEFPIESYEDLEQLDNEIANGKQKEYTAKLKHLLGGDALPKTLKNVFSMDLIYNSKSPWKRTNFRNIKIWKYEHFFDILLDTIQKLHPKEAAKPLLLKSLAAIRKQDCEKRNKKNLRRSR